MRYLRLNDNDYDKLLDKDVKHIQLDICDFITWYKSKNNSAAILCYIAAINKFYSMNDVTLNWKKINSYRGEHEKIAEDRPYTHSEIQTLISHASIRNRAIILLMSSGGLRMGAIPSLRIKDLESIDIDNSNSKIYKINVYAKSKSRYFTFVTPECRDMIDSYIEYRRRWAERITDDSPLFRADYNIHKTTTVKPITNYTIRGLTAKLLSRSGLRKPHTEGRTKRSHIMANHGYRKFFEKNAHKAGMDPIYIRRLMGQQSGLEDSYLKLSEEELLEGDNRHVGYVGIIDQLTIDETNRQRREIQTLRVEKSSWESMRKELDDIKALLKQD